jgi:hypothetical protein
MSAVDRVAIVTVVICVSFGGRGEGHRACGYHRDDRDLGQQHRR